MSYYMQFLNLKPDFTFFDLVDKYDELTLKYPECRWSVIEMIDAILAKHPEYSSVTEESYQQHFGLPRMRPADFDYSKVQ